MRLEGWEKKLEELIRERSNSPFNYGSIDCCLFACDAVEAITGRDPGEWFRGKYKSQKEAYRLLKEFADGEILETAEKITSALGMPEIHPNFAQRGDVVYCKIETLRLGLNYTLGILSINGQIAVPGKNGLEFYPLERGIKAWKV